MVTFVETDYTEPDIRYTLIGTAGGNDPDTGDIYRGLDRFGRIVDSYWYDYGSSADVDRIKYGYGRSGNRLWREIVVARSLGKYFDEKYLYDEIHRLKDMERGELGSGQSSITNLQFAQCWGLDETGNWSNFREDDDGDGDGDGSWNLNQNRTANKVNEISDITESTGPSWTTPAYSKAGNMTTVPKPADPTTSFTATYDAWNRLTKLVDTTSSDTVAEYEYDGAKRRTIQKSYTGGTLDETRHLYYTDPSQWQVIEVRVDSDTAPNRQFVWGLRYIDDLILRDRDTTGNGTFDERLYALQDANWNVTAIVDTVGTVQQRFNYTAYGVPSFLTPAFASGTNSEDWETLYAGYQFDPETSLSCIRHRVLDTSFGTWLQRDPLSLAAGINLYAYVDSAATTNVDPFGLNTLKNCLKDAFDDYDDCLKRATATHAKIQSRCMDSSVKCFAACVVLFVLHKHFRIYVACLAVCNATLASCLLDASDDFDDTVKCCRDDYQKKRERYKRDYKPEKEKEIV